MNTHPDRIMTPDHDLGATTPRDFLSPREVRIGDGAVRELGELLQGWGVAEGEVLVICDQALVDLGHVEAAMAALERVGHRVHVFAEVRAEPDSAMAAEVVRRVRERRHTAVVGMGGGSSMDLAKVAAALATSPGEVLDYVGIGKVTDEPLPLVLVPTTAGTGAEATRIAMISHEGEKRIINSPRLVPLAAILDPELIVSLPRPVTAATGLDALAHAVEGLLSTTATALTARMGRQAVQLLAQCLPRAYDDGSDAAARRGTLYGAYLAGLGLNAGVVLGHSIAYTIANRAHLPHGITAAMALPYCLAYNAPGAAAELEGIRAHAGLEGADGLYAWLADLNRSLEVPPSLQAVGIAEAEHAAMARECRERYPRPSNPVEMTEDRLSALYRFLWKGDLEGGVAALAS